MIDFSRFDRRPLLVAIAGPNGAGKTTFYQSYLTALRLPFVNADEIAAQGNLDPYAAAGQADHRRRESLTSRTSFIFETVFSDPVGDKVEFLNQAANSGYTVLLCYIGIADVEESIRRVAMRVYQGGHDVPDDKLRARFERTLANLARAIRVLPYVLAFENSDIAEPYRLLAQFESGKVVYSQEPWPDWLARVTAV